MCIFQSEQVIKLRFWLKKSPCWYLSRQISIRWIITWGAILGRYIRQKKPTVTSWRLQWQFSRSMRENISQTATNTATVTINHQYEITYVCFAVDFFDRGLHSCTAVAHLPCHFVSAALSRL